MFLLKKRRALLFIIDNVELLFLANKQRSSLSFCSRGCFLFES